MTIASAVNRVDYVGAANTEIYNYTFRIFSETDLEVKVRNPDTNVESTLALTTDYTVSGVGDEGGGSISLVDAGQEWLDSDGDLDTDWVITIRRVRPLTQETDIRNQGDFFPETHEDAFDHFVMVDQQQQEQINRSITLPVTISSSDVDTELPIPSAGLAIGWNEDGTALANIASAGDLTVSSFGESLLNDTTAAEARTTLDVTQAIANLTAETSPAVGDLIAIRDVSEPADNSMTLQNMLKVVNGLTEDTSPAVDDYFLSYDTSAGAAKKVTIPNIKDSVVRSVTGTDTAVATDEVLVLSGASFTETLFTAVGNTGRRLLIKHGGTSFTQVYTIDGNSSETIDGAATFALTQNGEALEIVSDGSNWRVVSFQQPGLLTSSGSSGTFSTSSTTFVDVTGLSVSITTRGRPVLVALQSFLGGNSTIGGTRTTDNIQIEFRLLRDATTLTDYYFSVNSNGGASTSAFIPGSLSYIDTPAAGTYTYKLQTRSAVAGSSPSTSIQATVLIAVEL